VVLSIVHIEIGIIKIRAYENTMDKDTLYSIAYAPYHIE